MNSENTLICKNCGSIQEAKNLIITIIPLSSGGDHQKACCSECGRFIKFIQHSVPALYFGKYKGTTIAEIARKDLPYLKWMDENNIASGNIKAAIKEVLKCPTP